MGAEVLTEEDPGRRWSRPSACSAAEEGSWLCTRACFGGEQQTPAIPAGALMSKPKPPLDELLGLAAGGEADLERYRPADAETGRNRAPWSSRTRTWCCGPRIGATAPVNGWITYGGPGGAVAAADS